MNQEWLAQPERSSTLAIRSLVWIALSLGRQVGQLLLYPICCYFLLFSVRARRASKAYLRRVLQRDPTWRDLFRHYYWFAATSLDRVFLISNQYHLFDIQIHGEELLLDALKRQQGCLLLGAHIGSFEVLRALGRERRGLRVRMVMFEDNARKTNAVLDSLDPHWASQVIEVGHFNSMLRVNECLERGEFVGMLGDRTLSSERQTLRPFLGEDAAFATAPFRIALMLQRPIILMLGLYRGGNRYELHFERLVDSTTVERSQREAAVQDWASRYVERLEHYCRLAPFNWFNFYDFWKQPDSKTMPRLP